MQIRCVIFLGNPVGYANNDAGKDGQSCLANPFAVIGLQKDSKPFTGCRLSDLKITGYDIDPDTGFGEIGPAMIVVNILNNDGSNKVDEESGINVSYHWCDLEDVQEYGGAGWYDADMLPLDGTSPLGDTREIFFALGEGIQFTNDSGYDSIKMICSGEVMQGQSVYPAATDGQQAAGNPLCRQISLSEITVDGYDVDPDSGFGEIGPAMIVVNILNNDGSNKVDEESGINVSYHWCDLEDVQEYGGAGWYDADMLPLDGTSPLGDASEIYFEMGEGIQVTNDSGYDTIVFHFPSLWATKAE